MMIKGMDEIELGIIKKRCHMIPGVLDMSYTEDDETGLTTDVQLTIETRLIYFSSSYKPRGYSLFSDINETLNKLSMETLFFGNQADEELNTIDIGDVFIGNRDGRETA